MFVQRRVGRRGWIGFAFCIGYEDDIHAGVRIQKGRKVFSIERILKPLGNTESQDDVFLCCHTTCAENSDDNQQCQTSKHSTSPVRLALRIIPLWMCRGFVSGRTVGEAYGISPLAYRIIKLLNLEAFNPIGSGIDLPRSSASSIQRRFASSMAGRISSHSSTSVMHPGSYLIWT